MTEEREEGYYWVGCDKDLEVVYFSRSVNKWLVVGSDNEYTEKDFEQIGPRIYPPD